jgi:ABC-type enterochelin transport system ATPase subunit
MLRNKDRYENKLDRLRLIAKQKSGKSSFVTQALLENIDHVLLDTFLNNVKTRKGMMMMMMMIMKKKKMMMMMMMANRCEG